jgi:DNA-binding response OmpR family regulator
MKKICLVEDESSLSDLIKMNLEIDGYHVETIIHGTEAFLRAGEMESFDLVILDVILP